jgi:glyoxylase-like metal-dependent hydrolase (beta-lactamase superfamily II)
VNTHWHLDHTSGNGRIKAYPDAPVYRRTAVDRVLADGGFLARNLIVEPMLDDPKVSDIQKEEVKIFMAMMAESDAAPGRRHRTRRLAPLAGRTSICASRTAP